MMDGASLPGTQTNGLQIDGLRVTAPGGRRLLEIRHLAIAPGERIGIRGPSGAGKSTLLYALAGLLGRIEGRIAWGDTNLAALPSEARARFRAANIGMIFQDFLLFDELGPLANASLTSLFQPRRRRAELAARAQAHLKRLGVPSGPRTVASFSGGERQRVAVARALAADAPILLADEPTAALHRDAADRLADDLAALARAEGKTLIAVSHDAALLSRMDRVLTITDGRLARD